MSNKNSNSTNATASKQSKAQSQALYAAAKRGDLDAFVAMMNEGVSPVIAEEYMGVPIMKMAGDDDEFASELAQAIHEWLLGQPRSLLVECADSYRGVVALLKAGADVREANPDGFTCLHRAVISGDKRTVQLAIAHGADLNAKGREYGWNGITPLLLAIQYGCPSICEMLIEAGADMYAVTDRGDSILVDVGMWGEEAETEEVFRVLAAAGFNYATLLERTGQKEDGTFFEDLDEQGLGGYADLFRSQLIEAQREYLAKDTDGCPSAACETLRSRL